MKEDRDEIRCGEVQDIINFLRSGSQSPIDYFGWNELGFEDEWDLLDEYVNLLRDRLGDKE